MKINEFIEKWSAKIDYYANPDGSVTINKTQVMKFKIDLYGLRKYDPYINSETKYISVFEAGKEWWNMRGIFSVESIAAKYNLRVATLNEYITAYLALRDWVEPFSVEYSIWDLYYFAAKGKPKDMYYINNPHETV